MTLMAQVSAPTAVEPPGIGPFISRLAGYLLWTLSIGSVCGLLFIGVLMAVGRRRSSSLAADGVAGIPFVIGGLALGASAAPIVNGVLGGF